MISAHSRLVHCRFSFCKKAGQEQRAFYLRTCDSQIVPAPLELYAMDFYGCGFVRSLGDNVRAHLAKRDDHAVHRAAGEGCTSHEAAIETLAGEQTGKQTHGGGGVSAIDLTRRRGEQPSLS